MRSNYRNMIIDNVNKKGFIIVAVLMIALMLTTLAGAFYLTAFYRTKLANQYLNSVKAYYLSASGIKCFTYLPYVKGESKEAEFSITRTGERIKVRSETRNGIIHLSSTAAMSGIQHSVSLELDANDDIVNAFAKMRDNWEFIADLPRIKWE